MLQAVSYCRITDLFDHPKHRHQRSAIRVPQVMDGSQIVPSTKLKFRDLWRISSRGSGGGRSASTFPAQISLQSHWSGQRLPSRPWFFEESHYSATNPGICWRNLGHFHGHVDWPSFRSFRSPKLCRERLLSWSNKRASGDFLAPQLQHDGKQTMNNLDKTMVGGLPVQMCPENFKSPEFGTWRCPWKIWKLTHIGGQSQHGNNAGTIRSAWNAIMCRICTGDASPVPRMQLESFAIADAAKIHDFATININWSDSLTFLATHHNYPGIGSPGRIRSQFS